MSKRDAYIDFLEREGFRPCPDHAAAVTFAYESARFTLIVDEEDEPYFRLVLPNFYAIDTPQEMAAALYAANEVNNLVKVARIAIVRDRVWSVAEMFVGADARLDDFFVRTLDTVRLAARQFLERMEGRSYDLVSGLAEN